MKRKIGIAAVVVGVVDLFVWIILLVSGNTFAGHGMSPLAVFVFVLWFVCIVVAIPCLLGDVVRFIGKSFAAGYNESIRPDPSKTAYCTNCGKPVDASVAFCPHCGTKLH